MSARRRRTSPITAVPQRRCFPWPKPQTWRVERSRVRQERFDEQHKDQKGGGQKGLLAPSGYFTAATGGTVYNGDVFPKEYWGNVFTGDVSGKPGASRRTGSGRSQLHRASRPSRARSSWPRPTCGSAPPTLPPGPTAIYMSPTCTARPSSSRSPFRKSSRRTSISGPGRTEAAFIAFRPSHPLEAARPETEARKSRAARSWWNCWPARAAGTGRRRIGFWSSGRTAR